MAGLNKENFIILPVTQLVKASWNYKDDDSDLKEKLKANLKRNGQIENIVVRLLDTGFYEIVNGNHRYDAMTEIGISDIMCYNLGTVSDSVAHRIAIELNETRFQTDRIRLAGLMKDMIKDIPIIELEESLPFTLEEIEGLVNLTDFDFNQFQERPMPKIEEEEPLKCPECGYVFPE